MQLTSVPEGKIVDFVDGKLRSDTPEEYVRQNIEKRLVGELKYPRERLKIEHPIAFGSAKPRVDIAVFPADCTEFTQESIQVIVECKKESVDPGSKKDGVEQLKSYMAACSNCEWGMWTNGKFRAIFHKKTDDRGRVQFEEYNDIPSASGSIEDVDRPERSRLNSAVEDNLLFVFKTCHNHIYATDGLEKSAAFFELLKVIFCKIEDERSFPQPLEFYTTSRERSNPDGQLAVKNRILRIFERVKTKQRGIFAPNETIELKPRSLAWIVSELQSYSLLNTRIDVKGKAYEEIVGANLRGDKGQFFTPRNIMRMAVDMIAPRPDERVLDPACGTGGFLVTAMTSVIDQLNSDMERATGRGPEEWSDDERKLLQSRVAEVASSCFFGFDIAPELVRATKMNMVMNNDGAGHILNTNSLLPPHEWDAEFKTALTDALGLPRGSLRSSKDLAHFDVVLTNPPFGSKIPVKDAAILGQYDLGYIWEKDKHSGVWSRTDRLQGSVPPEQLFIERCLQLLKAGGRMAIVLPDSILGSPGLGYIRQWLMTQARVVASIDLHVDTFQPRNGTQTSVLVLEKRSTSERQSIEAGKRIPDAEVFMAMVERVGHDKRGNPIFLRDREGNDVLVQEVDARGQVTLQRVVDDQSPFVAGPFLEWRKQQGLSW